MCSLFSPSKLWRVFFVSLNLISCLLVSVTLCYTSFRQQKWENSWVFLLLLVGFCFVLIWGHKFALFRMLQGLGHLAGGCQAEADHTGISQVCCQARERCWFTLTRNKGESCWFWPQVFLTRCLPHPSFCLPPLKQICFVVVCFFLCVCFVFFFPASSPARTVRHCREFFLVFCLSRKWFI